MLLWKTFGWSLWPTYIHNDSMHVLLWLLLACASALLDLVSRSCVSSSVTVNHDGCGES